MKIAHTINYINLGFLVMLFGLCVAQYARVRRESFGYYAVGAFVFGLAVASAAFPGWILGGVVVERMVEAVGLLIFVLAFMRDDEEGFSRPIVAVAVVLFVFFDAVLLMGVLSRQQSDFYLWVMLCMQAVFAVFPLARLIARPRPGSHYLAQGFLFFAIGVALAVAGVATENQLFSGALRNLAYAFGFFSLVLYVDASATEAYLAGLEDDLVRASLFDISSDLIRVFDDAKAPEEEPELVKWGVERVAESVSGMGYGRFFFARPPDGSARVRFSDCFGRGAVLETFIELPREIVDESRNNS